MTRRARRLAAALTGLATVTGCSAAAPADKPYVFTASDSPVDVDTPELRAQKAAAGIESCPDASAPTEAPEGLPDVTLPCLGGGPDVNLAGLRGSPMVINFWAQYCGPCRRESPVLQGFHQSAGDDVEVIGVDWQDTRPGWAIGFADELGITYPQLADPDAATRAPLNIQALPMTVLVDADGTIAYVERSEITSVSQLSKLVEDHLGVHVDVGTTS